MLPQFHDIEQSDGETAHVSRLVSVYSHYNRVIHCGSEHNVDYLLKASKRRREPRKQVWNRNHYAQHQAQFILEACLQQASEGANRDLLVYSWFFAIRHCATYVSSNRIAFVYSP